MKVTRSWSTMPFLLASIVLLGCSPFSGQADIEIVLENPTGQQKNMHDAARGIGSDLTIIATTPLVAGWVNQVGGTRLSAASIIPYSIDPHSYQPAAKDIAAITRADYIFAVGLLYEATWLTKLLDSHPETTLVELGDSSSPIKFQGHHEGHSQNEGHYDPHFWFDPLRVSSVIGKIVQVLSDIDPDGMTYYAQRAEAYTHALQGLDDYISIQMETIPEARRKLILGHESLGYLGERYNILILQAVIPNLSSETGPTPQDLTEAIKLVREHDVPAIFVETETTGKSAERIAQETGVRVAGGLSVETLREGQSYIDFMKYNLEVIVSNLVE